jgi:hypothetical protein
VNADKLKKLRNEIQRRRAIEQLIEQGKRLGLVKADIQQQLSQEELDKLRIDIQKLESTRAPDVASSTQVSTRWRPAWPAEAAASLAATAALAAPRASKQAVRNFFKSGRQREQLAMDWDAFTDYNQVQAQYQILYDERSDCVNWDRETLYRMAEYLGVPIYINDDPELPRMQLAICQDIGNAARPPLEIFDAAFLAKLSGGAVAQ